MTSTRRSVIVVGSGIAGLTTAIRAAEHHDVVLVSHGALEASNTWHAQGGIAGAIGAGDDVSAHVADTIAAGDGLADERAVRVLCGEAPARLRDLVALGVPFDRDGAGFALGLEAAHSAPRILHAGGDATGAAIEKALVAVARERVALVLEHHRLTDLLVEHGTVVGVRLHRAAGPTTLRADVVVLATGGFAGLYRHTSNPASATGSGIAIAARAGAAVADLEFVQFHPTVLAGSGGFLLSEAVRGEGAMLRDETGTRFMLDAHPAAELAPRDIVARAIAARMAQQGGRPVFLDATAIEARRLDARFPSIARRVRSAGLDWTSEPVPVTPAAHYTMGGIATDLYGRTTVPGLFAVGEVARTGVHGANRLASNSLVEGAVFGARAAAAIAASDDAAPLTTPAERTRSVRVPSLASPSASPSRVPSASASPAAANRALGDVLWDDVGLVRSESGLERAAADIERLGTAAGSDRDTTTVAALLARAALERRESRGAHARSDHPATDPATAAPTFFVAAAADRERLETHRRAGDRHETEGALAC